jgi:chloramphenicol 3-O-phosphotransferase
MGGILLFGGVPGVGKSTVARIVATRLQRGVHIESDVLQRFIVNGGLWPDGEPRDEARRQLRLRTTNSALLARSFYDAGFLPVVDDVIIGSRLDDYAQDLVGCPLWFVMLTAAPVRVRARNAGRPGKDVYHKWAHLDEVVRTRTRRAGLWLDSTGLSAEETAALVLARVWSEGSLSDDQPAELGLDAWSRREQAVAGDGGLRAV